MAVPVPGNSLPRYFRCPGPHASRIFYYQVARELGQLIRPRSQVAYQRSRGKLSASGVSSESTPRPGVLPSKCAQVEIRRFVYFRLPSRLPSTWREFHRTKQGHPDSGYNDAAARLICCLQTAIEQFSEVVRFLIINAHIEVLPQIYLLVIRRLP